MNVLDTFATGLIALLACIALGLVPLFGAAWFDERRRAPANRRRGRELLWGGLSLLALAACLALVRVFLERIG